MPAEHRANPDPADLAGDASRAEDGADIPEQPGAGATPEPVDPPEASDSPSEPGPAPGADDGATPGVDDVLGRQVGLVALPPTSGEDLTARVDQVRRLARLHHPHLLEVYDVDNLTADAENVLVLESVPGTRFDELLDDGPLPLERAAEIGARIASGLAHAHGHGVVHGHIGPASIVVDDRRHVWLVGLTHTIRGDADGPAPTHDDDVRALLATITAAVGADDAAELRDAAAGADEPGRDAAPTVPTAAGLSDRLFRVARRDEAPTGLLTPPAAPTPAAPTSPAPTPAALPSQRTNGTFVPIDVHESAVRSAGEGAGQGAGERAATAWAGPAVPAPRARPSTEGAATPLAPAAGRSTSPAGRRPLLLQGTRAAALGLVAATLILVSGVVIWAREATTPEAARAVLAPSPPAATAPPAAPAAAPDRTTPRRSGPTSRESRGTDASAASDDTGATGAAGATGTPTPGAPSATPTTSAPAAPTPTGPTSTTDPAPTATTAPPTGTTSSSSTSSSSTTPGGTVATPRRRTVDAGALAQAAAPLLRGIAPS